VSEDPVSKGSLCEVSLREGSLREGSISQDRIHDAPTSEAAIHDPRRAAVFLDKDGTLIEDVPYNVDPDLVVFTPHALSALVLLARAGYALVVVTNQSGLAHGRFSAAGFSVLRRALTRRLRQEAGIELAGFQFCPHAPDASGDPVCLCRKPAPGMLEQAAVASGFDLSRSWMIGDILDDIEAGRRAGCRTVLLDVGNETVWRMTALRQPNYRCADLLEAARIITGAGFGIGTVGVGRHATRFSVAQ
jgi:histidinol-phosphate phosphatase family protein